MFYSGLLFNDHGELNTYNSLSICSTATEPPPDPRYLEKRDLCDRLLGLEALIDREDDVTQVAQCKRAQALVNKLIQVYDLKPLSSNFNPGESPTIAAIPTNPFEKAFEKAPGADSSTNLSLCTPVQVIENHLGEPLLTQSQISEAQVVTIEKLTQLISGTLNKYIDLSSKIVKNRKDIPVDLDGIDQTIEKLILANNGLVIDFVPVKLFWDEIKAEAERFGKITPLTALERSRFSVLTGRPEVELLKNEQETHKKIQSNKEALSSNLTQMDQVIKVSKEAKLELEQYIEIYKLGGRAINKTLFRTIGYSGLAQYDPILSDKAKKLSKIQTVSE